MRSRLLSATPTKRIDDFNYSSLGIYTRRSESYGMWPSHDYMLFIYCSPWPVPTGSDIHVCASNRLESSLHAFLLSWIQLPVVTLARAKITHRARWRNKRARKSNANCRQTKHTSMLGAWNVRTVSHRCWETVPPRIMPL